MQQAVELVVLALAVSALSLTITKAKVTAPVRDWIADRNVWFGDLVSCPYCTSHWLAFGAVAAFQPVLITSGFLLLDLFVSAFVIVALSAMLSGLMFKSMKATH